MRAMLSRFLRDARGTTAIEYGMIASVIVIGLIGGLNAIGGKNSGSLWSVANKFAAAAPAN